MSRTGTRSIRTRLLRALMSMTLVTLTMATGLSALMDLKLFQDHVLRDLRVLAAVVGESCVSTLVFDSPETAERYLATLAREYSDPGGDTRRRDRTGLRALAARARAGLGHAGKAAATTGPAADDNKIIGFHDRSAYSMTPRSHGQNSSSP